MRARQKLNRAFLIGDVAFAALCGWMFDSLVVFIVAAALFLAGSCIAGEIRPDRTRGRTPRGRTPRRRRFRR